MQKFLTATKNLVGENISDFFPNQIGQKLTCISPLKSRSLAGGITVPGIQFLENLRKFRFFEFFHFDLIFLQNASGELILTRKDPRKLVNTPEVLCDT